MEKRRNCSPQEQFLLFSTIFSNLILDFCVITRTRFFLRDKRLFEITEVEITTVDCIVKKKEDNKEEKQKMENRMHFLNVYDNHPMQSNENESSQHQVWHKTRQPAPGSVLLTVHGSPYIRLAWIPKRVFPRQYPKMTSGDMTQ